MHIHKHHTDTKILTVLQENPSHTKGATSEQSRVTMSVQGQFAKGITTPTSVPRNWENPKELFIPSKRILGLQP